jgi:hypothetical protein
MYKRFLYTTILIILPVIVFVIHSRQANSKTVITLDPTTTYQTMIGWEAVAQAGQRDCPGFNQYKNDLFDQAINDLGINRLRVEVRANGANSLTLNKTALDYEIENVVLPMREMALANNEELFINVNFVGQSDFTAEPNMSAYAEQVLEVYEHMMKQYGFVPDGWEIALEPGLVSPGWGVAKINDALVRTEQILSSHGYPDPYLIAPSTPCGAELALNTFNDMLHRNNNLPIDGLDEFAYHRYCEASEPQLNAISELGTRYGINTAMLEHGGANYQELHADLKLANVSAWQQFALAYCTEDNGFQYYPVQGDDFILGERTKYLRQYFKYIRKGAVRFQALSSSADFDPVAFLNTDQTYVIVVKANDGGALAIGGLPEGIYGIKYTTDRQYDVDLPNLTILAGQELETAIPEKGVITIFALTSNPQINPNSALAAMDNPTKSVGNNVKTCYIHSKHLCRKK